MEKKKSIVFKKITVSILSILFVVCAYLPNIPKVNALTNVITYNNYGSFSRTNEAFGLSGTSGALNLGCSSVVGELNGIYNGTVTINYSIGTGLSIANFSIIPENCHIISYSSYSCTIEFYGVSNWSVTFLETQTRDIASLWDDLTINSLTNWNMTYLERSDSAVMVNIQNRLSDLKTYTDGIEGLITTNNQLLQTIATNTANSSGGTSIVTNIDVNVDHIADDLNLLKASNDSILANLLSFFTNSLGQVVTIDTVVSAIDDVQNQLVGVNTNLVSINSQLTSINTTLTSLLTSVQNIDNTIDTITWKTRSSFVGLTSDFVNYTNTGNLTVHKNEFVLFNQTLTNNQINDVIYKLELYGNFPDDNFVLVYANSNGTRQTNIDVFKLYQYRTSSKLTVYFQFNRDLINLSIPWGNDVKIGVKNLSNSNIVVYSSYIGTNELMYIEDTDTEFWQLLSYFNQYNMNNKILNAINSISVNITQNDITEMNNNITEYNSTMTDINQIENNYINNFNTLNNGIDLSNNSTPSVNLIDARTRFNGVFNDITSDLRIRGILILVLVCGVVLILLGA